MAKKLAKRITDLGGSILIPLGFGDEQAPRSHYEALIPWMETFFQKMNLKANDKLIENIPFKFSLILEPQSVGHIKDFGYKKDIFQMQVVGVTRQTSLDHFQKVFKVDFKIPNDITYSPGDVVEIFSSNSDRDIEEILELFGWTTFADMPVRVVASRSDANFPNYLDSTFLSLTFREFLQRHLLISHTTPTQRFFGFLAQFLRPYLAPLFLEKLQELGDIFNADSVETYEEYCLKPRRRILEILRDFLKHPDNPTMKVQLPPETCFDLFSWISPRPFSISSFLVENILSITSALVEFPSSLLRSKRQGFFSSTLDSIANCGSLSSEFNASATQFYARIYKGSMYLPVPLLGPLIFACAGTGIAPMISFLLSLVSRKLNHDLNPNLQIVLIYGYRYYEKDFLHRQDLARIQKILGSDQFTMIHGASRQSSSGKKIYIDDLVWQYENLLRNLLLQSSSYFYLCGNTKLPGRMKELFLKLGINYNLMESQGRFQVETW